MTAWAWGWRFLKPQNPVFPGNHGRKCPRIHCGSSYFFQCHYNSCIYDAPRLAFDPNELWKMMFEQLLVKFRRSRGRCPSQSQQWFLFIKVAVSWPELVLQCLSLPRDSNNWNNNHDINSYQNMSTVGATVMKMTSRVCETLKVGFRSHNNETYSHMIHSLMCSEELFKQHFPRSSFAVVKCQIITDVEFYV